MDLTLSDKAQRMINSIPKVSPLDGVDPTGRVDVTASRIIEKLVESTGDLGVRTGFQSVKPVLDTILMISIGPTMRAPRKRTRTKKAVKV